MNYLPANKYIIDVDSAKVLSNGTVKNYYKNRLVSPMIWEYSDGDAYKGDLAIMDLLSTNKWERPVYFSTTVPSTQYKGLEKYFIQEGLAYRVVPVKTDKPEQGEFGMIDPLVMYDNMMNKFKWGMQVLLLFIWMRIISACSVISEESSEHSEKLYLSAEIH